MHYYMGLKEWHEPVEIFVEILKKIDMMDCESMDTSMRTNLKKL